MNRYTDPVDTIGSWYAESINEVMEMGRNKKASNPSQKKLVKYFTYAAKDVGQASEEAVIQNKCYPNGQAFYSLLWYFEHCIERDLDPKSPCFNPLLDAYLNGDISAIINPPRIDDAQRAEERRLLDTMFPQSEYPLNPRQIEAVHKALHFPFSIIKGPPGTGKTETILRIAALAVAKGQNVAVVSTNKAAVENVDQKLEREALRFYGPPSFDLLSLHETNDLAFAAACKHASLGDKKKRAKAEDPVTSAWLAFDAETNHGIHVFADGESMSGWEQNKLHGEFTAKHPLVTSTVHSLKKCFADGDVEKYDLVIMDEASQTNLIVGIVAMSCAKRMVLVGDEEQLPPVITEVHQEAMSTYAKRKKLFKKGGASPYDISRDGLSFLTSCYEVFSDRSPVLMTMLNEHFRCHPAIIGFCNQEVYGGELVIKSHPKNLATPCPIRICWYEGDYREGVWPPKAPPEENPNQKQRSTYVNRKQLLILEQEEAAHLQDLAHAGKSICILSPFRGQIYALMNSVKWILAGIVQDSDIALETSYEEESDSPRVYDPIYTLTIHKSQGREFDSVYLLPVEDGNWEWPWSQGRRLVNVAASRAKEELVVILSTKLMEDDTQYWLAGRNANVTQPARAADDKNNQEMYVRRLVEYVRRLAPEKEGQSGCDAYYGFHKSVITSVFDEVPFRQGRKRNKEWAPESCIKESLQDLRVEGVSVAQNVKLDQLSLSDGALVSEACAGRYIKSDEAHYDFVLYESHSKHVLMAIEVDGMQHRFKRKSGRPDDSQRELDETKNAVAKEVCGADLCWLGKIRMGSLATETGNAEAIEGESASKSAPRSAWPSWKCFPSKISTDANFVFLRIPSDGSTFWETEALHEKALALGANKVIANDYLPPTIEEYLEKQRRLNTQNAAKNLLRYLGEEGEHVATPPAKQPGHNERNACNSGSENVSITKCLEEWRQDSALAELLVDVSAADMNRRLVSAGYQVLEDGNYRKRKPSERGRSIGISEFSSSDAKGPYISPCYSAEARAYLAAHMQELLES